jgi:penicillin-binding protein 1C
MLADDAARSESFGSDGPLRFPFPAAAKTGTSKGFRDNWVVGYTRERTVAVWVGNFDGRPMVRSSGVSGAGPLFHAVMVAAMRTVSAAPLVLTDGLVAARVCALSGARPGPACKQQAVEHFLPEHPPHESCQYHELVAVDPTNGLRAGPACKDAELTSFERYPASELAWALSARRPLAPTDGSPRCPPLVAAATASAATAGPPRIAWPRDGARFVLDTDAELQDLLVEVAGPSRALTVRLLLDEREVARGTAPLKARIELAPGEHSLRAVAAGESSPPVRVRVDPG